MDVREKATNDKRLIDYDEIRRLFDAQYKETVQLIHDGEAHLDNLAEGFTEADRIIQKIPTVDAVEVVRCRECFYYTPVDKNTGKCAFLIGAHQYVVPDGYCYLGERKEGADNG